jgi:hypothetical protein
MTMYEVELNRINMFIVNSRHRQMTTSRFFKSNVILLMCVREKSSGLLTRANRRQSMLLIDRGVQHFE